jgi:hypothetical protein
MTTTATHNAHDTTPERVLFVAFELSSRLAITFTHAFPVLD